MLREPLAEPRGRRLEADLCERRIIRMLVRLLCSIGAAIVTAAQSLFACICIDGWLRPPPMDGSYGMYGFLYGLVIAPTLGVVAAVLTYRWMRRRAS